MKCSECGQWSDSPKPHWDTTTIEGYKSIAIELERIWGDLAKAKVTVSERQACRYAQRKDDPLPAFRLPSGACVRLDVLAEWARRNFGTSIAQAGVTEVSEASI